MLTGRSAALCRVFPSRHVSRLRSERSGSKLCLRLDRLANRQEPTFSKGLEWKHPPGLLKLSGRRDYKKIEASEETGGIIQNVYIAGHTVAGHIDCGA